MSRKELGETFDIHGGGLDLVFPHHECEVAQSKAALGEKAFARYWIHNGFINVDNEKMSKSLGNFFTLKDIFKKYDPQVVRFMFLQTHYRNPINFSDKLLEQAKHGLQRIRFFVRQFENVKDSNIKFDDISTDIDDFTSQFEHFMDDDFNVSGALGALNEFLTNLNKKLDNVDVNLLFEKLKRIDSVLRIIFPLQENSITSDIDDLIRKRKIARDKKDFVTSDKIRDELKEKGIELEDTPHGTIWKKL